MIKEYKLIFTCGQFKIGDTHVAKIHLPENTFTVYRDAPKRCQTIFCVSLYLVFTYKNE